MEEITNDFYVGWGTLALINANIAQVKGKSGLMWFIASLLLGPLASLLLLVREKEKGPPNAATPE